MQEKVILETSPECEIVTSREFNFPRQLVYRAWTEPDHLKNWWGPNGFTNTFEIFEPRPGGRWLFTMHGPEQGHYRNACTFLILREPELLVWNRQSKPLFQVVVVFQETGQGRTRVIFRQQFESKEDCDKLRKFVPEKNEENMDRLEAELLRMI